MRASVHPPPCLQERCWYTAVWVWVVPLHWSLLTWCCDDVSHYERPWDMWYKGVPSTPTGTSWRSSSTSTLGSHAREGSALSSDSSCSSHLSPLSPSFWTKVHFPLLRISFSPYLIPVLFSPSQCLKTFCTLLTHFIQLLENNEPLRFTNQMFLKVLIWLLYILCASFLVPSKNLISMNGLVLFLCWLVIQC